MCGGILSKLDLALPIAGLWCERMQSITQVHAGTSNDEGIDAERPRNLNASK